MLAAMRSALSRLPERTALPGNPDITLKRHQLALKELMAGDSPHRGLLAYHGLGSGKTCAALVVARALLEDPARRLVVMMPASLKKEFAKEMDKCGRGIDGSRVSLVSTNGIAPAKIDPEGAGVDGVSLHGAAVIVDEVHNMVSQVVNRGVGGSGRGSRLFRALYAARDAKIVLLSGTPVVNRPFEVAVLMCMLRGPIHTIVLKNPKGASSAVTRKLLRHPRVAAISNDGNTVTVLPVPSERHRRMEGGPPGALEYRRSRPGPVAAPGGRRTSGPYRDLGEELRALVQPDRVGYGTADLFPLDEEDFDREFVDPDANRLRADAREEFMARVAGRISHYEMSVPEKVAVGFPRVVDGQTSVVRLPLTKTQFDRYVEQRELESSIAKKLDLAKKRGAVEETAGVHRTLTRMVCNFAFARRGQRPFPSTMDAAAVREISEEGGAPTRGRERVVKGLDGRARKEDKAGAYRRAIADALGDLKRDGYAALREPVLSDVHSPKMGAIAEAVSRDGAALPALVYSQFRSLEGVGIMSAVLEARGYAELRLDTDGAVDPSVPFDRPLFALFDSGNPGLLAAFNGSPDRRAAPWFEMRARAREASGAARYHERWSPVDVLFITQSGAEGINLRGVRQVHVMEPYWNDVRIQQVIGRAARTKSHDHLPPDQRRVDVYRYVSVMTPEQRETKDIKKQDGGKTSDELLYGIAARKTALVSTFLDAVASAAADCGVYPGSRSGPGKECWAPRTGSKALSELDVVAEAEERAARGLPDAGRARTVKVVRGPGGTLRLVDKETGEDAGGGKLFDAAVFRDTGRLEVARIASRKSSR